MRPRAGAPRAVRTEREERSNAVYHPLVDRTDISAETRSAPIDAVQGCTGVHVRWLAERKAGIETLERSNLIAIAQGGKGSVDLNADKTR